MQVELCCGVQRYWVWSLQSAKLCWVARSCMCWEVLPLSLLGLNLVLGFTVINDNIELREEIAESGLLPYTPFLAMGLLL